VQQGNDLGQEYFHILYSPKDFQSPPSKGKQQDFKIILYLLAFVFSFNHFFFCDYIQIKKKGFDWIIAS